MGVNMYMWFIFLFLAAMSGYAQTSSVEVSSSSANNNAQSADTSSANQAVFADINIFSNMPFGSIYVLWSNFDLSADIKKQIMERSFVLEPYFMQNIDREEFEQNQILHIFEEQRKAFIKLFPDEEDEE